MQSCCAICYLTANLKKKKKKAWHGWVEPWVIKTAFKSLILFCGSQYTYLSNA